MSIRSVQQKVPSIHASAFLAESCDVLGDVRIGAESSIWHGAVLRGDVEGIQIGDRTNIQDLSVIHSDRGQPTIIGNDVTVGHRAILHACVVHDFALIGMGAIVLNEVVIESESLIAAGAVVPPKTRVSKGWLMAGVPARPLRPLTELEIDRIRQSARHYVEYRKMYTDAASHVR